MSEGVYELPVPFAPSTIVPCTSPGDLGILFFAIIEGGQKYHGRVVALFTTEISESDRLKIWADGMECAPSSHSSFLIMIGIGVRASFREVTVEEYTARMATAMPPPIVQNVTEQLLIIGNNSNYLVEEDVIKGTDVRVCVVPQRFLPADQGFRSLIPTTGRRLGRNML